MSTRYLDPRNDLAFKKVFGAEKHKRIPIDFLNAVFHLEGQHKIVSLEFLNTRQAPDIEARKESIVDVLVQDQSGVKYIIEMQVAKIEGFEKRAQYYAAKTYCSHFGEGGKYPDLKKVIFLAITDYVVFPKKEGYKSDHIILDNLSHEHDLKDFYFTFVELPKFIKSLEDLQTIEDNWYYFLKHADESKDIEKILSHHPEIKEAYEILDRYHWTESELQCYEKLIMNVADAHGMIAAAKTEGLQEGIKKGHIAVAKAMREKGLPIDQIVLMTSLSEEEVLALPASELASKTFD
jgi:predicted transposase/invertase (TIGR01784 family)